MRAFTLQGQFLVSAEFLDVSSVQRRRMENLAAYVQGVCRISGLTKKNYLITRWQQNTPDKFYLVNTLTGFHLRKSLTA